MHPGPANVLWKTRKRIALFLAPLKRNNDGESSVATQLAATSPIPFLFHIFFPFRGKNGPQKLANR